MTITVEVRKGNLEKAMRVLKKKVAKEGIIKTLKEKQYFEKPSAKRNRKKAAGRARALKKQRQNALGPPPKW